MYKVIYDGSREKKDHKTVFSSTMMDLIETDPDVVYLDADLMNSSGTMALWKKHPDRAFNCGICEANMMAVAAGLSLGGLKPYAHTFGPFASRRCYDQVFISQGYADNPVRIYGSDPGVCAAFNGGTHMPFEDMALMRAIPQAYVFDIADGVQFEWVLRKVKDADSGVQYIRSTRKNNAAIYAPGSEFEIGKGNILRDGTDLTIIASGIMVGDAMAVAEYLAKEGISIRVVDMFTVKPLDVDLVVKCAQETGVIVTSENHNIIGGLGEAVAAALVENYPVPLIRHGVEDRFGQVGSVDELREAYGLTPERLTELVRKALKRK
ncbi:MAG: transketolase family protein [Clostridiaceae bacterium]|nr:transketolase family protein [Clostridiaceae bacterium]